MRGVRPSFCPFTRTMALGGWESMKTTFGTTSLEPASYDDPALLGGALLGPEAVDEVVDAALEAVEDGDGGDEDHDPE